MCAGYSTICEQFFLNYTGCVQTVLAMRALLLQASVCVFSVLATDRVPSSVVELQRHEPYKLNVVVGHIRFYVDYKKYFSQVRGRSKLSLARSQTASSPPALHYRDSLCMKSHLPQWRAHRIKVKGINKQVNCGTHAQLFPISMEQKLSLWILIIQLLCADPLQMYNNPQNNEHVQVVHLFCKLTLFLWM